MVFPDPCHRFRRLHLHIGHRPRLIISGNKLRRPTTCDGDGDAKIMGFHGALARGQARNSLPMDMKPLELGSHAIRHRHQSSTVWNLV